jgi:hypothetical protein
MVELPFSLRALHGGGLNSGFVRAMLLVNQRKKFSDSASLITGRDYVAPWPGGEEMGRSGECGPAI